MKFLLATVAFLAVAASAAETGVCCPYIASTCSLKPPFEGECKPFTFDKCEKAPSRFVNYYFITTLKGDSVEYRRYSASDCNPATLVQNWNADGKLGACLGPIDKQFGFDAFIVVTMGNSNSSSITSTTTTTTIETTSTSSETPIPPVYSTTTTTTIEMTSTSSERPIPPMSSTTTAATIETTSTSSETPVPPVSSTATVEIAEITTSTSVVPIPTTSSVTVATTTAPGSAAHAVAPSALFGFVAVALAVRF